jgi:hypothetical protein
MTTLLFAVNSPDAVVFERRFTLLLNVEIPTTYKVPAIVTLLPIYALSLIKSPITVKSLLNVLFYVTVKAPSTLRLPLKSTSGEFTIKSAVFAIVMLDVINA